MINYNERLNEILHELRVELRPLVDQNGRKWADEQYIAGKAEAKQAITSLIKELVAEAKPEKRELIEPVTGEPVSSGDKVTVDVEADPRGSLIFVQNNGYNMALNQFEQNLLKELEEK